MIEPENIMDYSEMYCGVILFHIVSCSCNNKMAILYPCNPTSDTFEEHKIVRNDAFVVQLRFDFISQVTDPCIWKHAVKNKN